jgi:hypothetical protein
MHPLQDVVDRRHGKGKVPVQVSVAKPIMPSRSTFVTNKRPTLGPLEATFINQGREVADEHIARCIYANGLAFNLVHSPYWRKMIKTINEAPKGYKSPGYEKVRTTLLTLENNLWMDSYNQFGICGWKQGCPSSLMDGEIKETAL